MREFNVSWEAGATNPVDFRYLLTKTALTDKNLFGVADLAVGQTYKFHDGWQCYTVERVS